MVPDNHKQDKQTKRHDTFSQAQVDGEDTPVSDGASLQNSEGSNSIIGGTRRNFLKNGAMGGLLPLIGFSGYAKAAENGGLSEGPVEALVELNYYVDEDVARVIFDVESNAFEGPSNLKAQATLEQEDSANIVEEGPLTPSNGVTVLSLPLDSVNEGEHSVTLRIQRPEKRGDPLWEGEDTLVKQPAPEGDTRITQIDRYRSIMLVDGEPFFPVGVMGAYSEQMDELADAGFNLTKRWKGKTTWPRYDRNQSWDSDHNQEAILPFLNAAEEAGLYVFESPVKLAEEDLYVEWNDLEFPEKYPIINNEITPGVVKHAKNHPAVIGYYTYDEPENYYADQPDHPQHLIMQHGVEEYYDVVRGLDPYHAVQLLTPVGLNAQPTRNVEADNEYWNAQDIITRDFYVNLDSEPMSTVYDVARQDYDYVINDENHPWETRDLFFFTPMFEKFSGRRKPLTPEEQRAQTYLSLVAGIRGLFYWDWPAQYHETWEMLKQLAGEIQELSPILLEQEPDHEVSYADEDESVKVLVKNHDDKTYPGGRSLPTEHREKVTKSNDGKTYLFAVNAEPAPAEVKYQLPEKYDGKATVRFEDRTVDLSEGTFTDTFEPYGRHVYELPSGSWEDGAEVILDIDVGESVEYTDPQFEPTEDNLIANPSFEYDLGGLPGFPAEWDSLDTGMQSGATNPDGGIWAPVTDESIWGDRSLRMTKVEPGTGDSYDIWNRLTVPTAHTEVNYPEDGEYTLSVWLKADEPVTLQMWTGWAPNNEFEVGTEWERYEVTYDHSAGGSFLRFYLLDQGTLWMDGVQLEKGTEATEFTPVEPVNKDDL